MNTDELEGYFLWHWEEIVGKCMRSPGLDPDDRERILNGGDWKDLQANLSSSGDYAASLPPHMILQIKPELEHISTFAKFFETRLAPNLDSGFLRGIIGILVQATFGNEEAGVRIPRMIRSIAYKAETFNSLCEQFGPSQELANSVKEACFKMQVQIVEFFVEAIEIIRGEHLKCKEEGVNTDDLWAILELRYTEMNQELLENLRRVERRVETDALLRSQVLSPGDDLQSLAQAFRCLLLPKAKTPLFDRVDVFKKIDEALGKADSLFSSVALYGLAGVGKSAVASTYVERLAEENRVDVVLWAHSETSEALRQSFTDIAMKLKLPEAKPQEPDNNLLLVHDWLLTTDSRWIVVFDNAESEKLLAPYWPGASHGKAIITTRNHKLALRPANQGFEIRSWDSHDGANFLLFLLKQNIGRDTEAETKSALQLSEILSGHALAIQHMAGLIHGRSFSITDFMNHYLKNPRRIHKPGEKNPARRSELEMLWEYSFESLRNTKSTQDNNLAHLDFLFDEFDLADSVESLLSLSLVHKNRDTRVFSIHRMVQQYFRYHLTAAERQTTFDDAVAIVYQAFPKQDNMKAQLYEQWTECNRYVQHVLYLKSHFRIERKLNPDFKATWQFCELLKECQRYMYESNALQDLRELCECNLIAANTLDDGERTTDLVAVIYSHQANLEESLGNPLKAIELNKKGYEMRLRESELKQGLLAGFESNLGYNYNTANDHKSALQWFHKARDRWYQWMADQGKEPDWPTHMKANTARCLVYLDNLAEARRILDVCIPEFKVAAPLNWGMLAYAYHILGTLERRESKVQGRSGNAKLGVQKLVLAEAHFMEAQNIWLKGDNSRHHPFNGGCMHGIGICCLEQGKIEAAIKHLRDSCEVTKRYSDTMPIEHGRCLFKLSEALLQSEQDDDEEARRLRSEAEELLKKRRSDTSHIVDASFDDLIPIFWRGPDYESKLEELL
ncbi:hypothetical protein SAPIO_CDS1836 [Scedosporium apiospermum]|uniref:Uncharacterized protein n=1 Tax=Pseudallescheria apiosperma TaxID=563466 RepID=A0A084GDV0_PSEDA|nr:uncharacterized protein SAPIO_CDS1836 [Scedosporium apiospermum]KEZ45512.1 hypothetical protein SAPIO_CDS1836 [Scedosporium apiospermum]